MARQTQGAGDDQSEGLTHPLMPGVRCEEVWNRDWPRTLHDKQITGFSPLVLGMDRAPRVWATLDVGGEVNWVERVTGNDGSEFLLVNDGRLRFVSAAGEVVWTLGDEGPRLPDSQAARPAGQRLTRSSLSRAGRLLFFGDVRGNGRDYLLLGGGARLALLDAATGKIEWSHQFRPPHAQVRVAVGDILLDRQGMEAVVFLAYAEEGCLIHFPPEGEPQIVWEQTVVEPDEHPERYDHGCSIQLDLSVPDRPLVWNVRHHRCRGFDARTGETVSSLVYKIGGGNRRNYGPWAFGWGEGGRPLICVVAEAVQEHVHAIHLNRNGPSELAWQHYYGEVYVVPGVVVEHVAVADMDGDGETEVVYNVRDPEQGYRSFVRVRDADTGFIQAEIPDHWCVGPYSNLGPVGANGLLVYAAPEGATPNRGDLIVYRFESSGGVKEVATLKGADRWGPETLPGEEGDDLLVRQTDENGEAALVRYALRDGRLEPVSRTAAGALLEAPILDSMEMPNGGRAFLVAGREGKLLALSWEGDRLWELSLTGGAPPTLSAGDLNADGRAELVAAGNRARVFSFAEGETPKQIGEHEFLGSRSRHSPLLYDLEGDGGLCLIAPGSTPHGRLAVRAYRGDGSLLWETDLGESTAYGGTATSWNAGHFLPGPRAGVAISVTNTLRTVEGTYLLDGRNGEILWHKGRYWDGDIVRPYISNGIPGAFDVDGDGMDEICMDMLSYMAMLRGTDGEFSFLGHTRNIRQEGSLYAGLLYNSFVPVYAEPGDEKPHWLVTLGHGSFGLMNPDPTDGVWREEPGYDTPPRIGMVDVDGDGAMEVGYSLQNDSLFTCRALWTGEVKWEIALPSAPNSPVIAADVDGDGKGEFLVGSYCIGTDAEGRGEIRWESPVPLGWAIIADFDGDGRGEIACGGGGRVYILKAEE